MADDNIVGQEWGNPHRYGSTIWDVFVPRPGWQRELQQNLYATGYNEGPSPAGVVEPRSPFGSLLQKVGILGEPDARPLTDYEKMLVSKGGLEKRQEEMQLDEEQVKNIQSRLNLVQDYIDTTGNMPPDDFMRGLSQSDTTGAFRQQIMERGREMEMKEARQRASLDYMRKQSEYQDYLMGRDRSIDEANKQMAYLNKIGNDRNIRYWIDKYNEAYSAALEETEQFRQANLLAKAQQYHQILTKAIAQKSGNPELVNAYVEKPADTLDPFGLPDAATGGEQRKRLFSTPEEVTQALQYQGLISPTPGYFQPTPTPRME